MVSTFVSFRRRNLRCQYHAWGQWCKLWGLGGAVVAEGLSLLEGSFPQGDLAIVLLWGSSKSLLEILWDIWCPLIRQSGCSSLQPRTPTNTGDYFSQDLTLFSPQESNNNSASDLLSAYSMPRTLLGYLYLYVYIHTYTYIYTYTYTHIRSFDSSESYILLSSFHFLNE